jgi:hypothetical protein
MSYWLLLQVVHIITIRLYRFKFLNTYMHTHASRHIQAMQFARTVLKITRQLIYYDNMNIYFIFG